MIIPHQPFQHAPIRKRFMRRGLGNLNFGGNGTISCAGIDPSLCDANKLQQALAYAWNKPLSTVNAQCNVGGAAGSGCVGYLQNVVQWLQGGNVTYTGGQFSWCGAPSGTWGGPSNPSCSPTGQPLTPAPPQPSVVNPSPAGQPTATGTSATSPYSAVSQANGGATTSGGTVNQGGLSTFLSGSTFGISNEALLVAGGALAIWLLTKKK